MAEPSPVRPRRRAVEVQNGTAPQMPDRDMNRATAIRLHEAVRAAGGNLAVARRSGVPLATVNNYVRGRNGMKIEPLSALAAACNVSLEWLVSGRALVATELPAGPDFPTAVAALPPGLGEAPATFSPAGMTGGIDLRILAKAIEIVAAITGAAAFQDDPKGLARRIATTYAVLIQPETPHD
jgi:transcriptional regulator with XRE-family HTH domain